MRRRLRGLVGLVLLTPATVAEDAGPAAAKRLETSVLRRGPAAAARRRGTQERGSPGSLADYRFDPESAARWTLPGRLAEVSGLAVTADGRLLAHGDEEGVVYELDYRSGGIVKRFRLSDTERPVAGDFEGIAAVEDRIYLVTSAGRLFECREGADRESVLFQVHATGVGRDCEVEGLAYDAARRDLLLLCKRSRGADLRGRVAIYRWSVIGERLREESRTVIPVADFARPLGEDEFRPSGIEWRAASGNYFLVAARPGAVAEVTPDGRVLAVERLSARRHRQAEGIAFAPDGALIVADEGAGRRARLTVYPVSGAPR